METAATVFSAKRAESYNGTTDVNGDFIVVFSTPFASAPRVFPAVTSTADAMTRVRATSISATGFTVHAEKNATVTVLSLDVVSLNMANVAGVAVSVMVMEA